MRYFEVINIDYKNAQTFVDGIRLFANSKIKHKAHVTIKGPSQSKIVPERIKYENQIIKITGIGNFFSENQNTVFLKCELEERLKKLINKPDFGSGNPHITLYDGEDNEFANQLFQLGQNYSIKFQFIVNELDIIKSNKLYWSCI